ncbi:MAG: ComF family protein [Patescibacteria group bacterium]
MWLNKVKKFFLDLFFPKKCLGCNCPDTYLCRDCFNKIEITPNNTCFFCGKITWQGKICIGCAKENGLDRLIAATEYKNPVVQDLIKNFKYHYVQELTKPLSDLLIKTLESLNFGTWNLDFIIIPVPLYKYRLHYRGFNQAELLAREVAEHFKLLLENDILKRKISTTPQAKIKDMEKRRTNLKEVFEISPESSVEGKIIILIDDVTTTGATLVEAAKILKKSGAQEVWGLVIAKG